MSDVVRIIPLGGLGQIGNNLCVIEQGERRILIDCGLSFPRDEMPGVDLVLPDFAYLREAPGGIDAVVLTHGHEDHIGALPYVMREIGVREVWGTRLTLGMVKSKLDEHGLLRDAEFIEIDTGGDPVACGPFAAEFARVTHSVPGCRRGRAPHPPRHDPAHRRLQDRPHADRRARDRPRQARATRLRRRRPHARRLDERRAAGHHAVRAARRGGAQAHHPRRARPRDRDELLVAHPPAAGRDRRLRGVRPQRRRRRPLDDQEPQHRAQPGLRRRRGGHADQALRAGRAAGRPGHGALHGLAGRADVGAHAHGLQRSPPGADPPGRHRDHVGQAGAGQRARGARHDERALPRAARASCTRTTRRCTSRATARPRSSR